AVQRLGDVDDVDDARVLELARRLRLAHEAVVSLVVAGELLEQEFDRKVTVGQLVIGCPHLAHAATGQAPEETVAPRDLLADLHGRSVPALAPSGQESRPSATT